VAIGVIGSKTSEGRRSDLRPRLAHSNPQESWLISLPEELQSDELLRAITSGKVNSLSGACEPFEQSSELSKSSRKLFENVASSDFQSFGMLAGYGQ
jgi:hypothetical protein